MSKRALITGAAGFVGGHLARRLVSQGWDVVLSDRNTPGFIACDFGAPRDIDALLETTGSVTHVFHLAARTFVPESMADPSGAFEVNLLGTVHLLSRLARYPMPPRVVFIGSAEAYGRPQFLPMTEEHPLEPQNPYAISKAAADHFAAYVARTSNIEIIRMRPFNHSGAGQTPQFALSSFAKQVADIEAGHEEPVLRVGNLDALRDFSHVEDVVAAYEAAALRGVPGEAYNVCAGHAVTLRSALEGLLARSTADIQVEVDPARFRPLDVPEVRGSYEKLERHTGWKPERGMDHLLDDVLGYWRAEAAGLHP
jgi:GDP-4-dehydro-6-deoxy-D-mannose reductase